jgi:hypothetical protein
MLAEAVVEEAAAASDGGGGCGVELLSLFILTEAIDVRLVVEGVLCVVLAKS